MKDKYDIIIIGSGIGGLVSAALLSNAGKRVLIIEKEHGAGGYLKGFKNGDFAFDTSLHLLNGCKEGRYTYNIFKRCNITDNIKFLKPKYLYRGVFPDREIRVPQEDPDKYKETLSGLFPKSREGVEKFFDEVSAMFQGILNLDKNIAASTAILPYFKKTLEEVLGEYIKDAQLRTVICQSWSYFGLPPSKLRAIDFCYPWFDYIKNGGYYVKNGGYAIVAALVNQAKKMGVDFLFSRDVDKILIENGRCQGVKVGDDHISCNAVISNIDLAKTIYDLVGRSAFSPISIKKLRSIEPSISDFEIFLGLNINLKDKYPDEYEIFVNPDYDIEGQYKASLENKAYKTSFTIAIYSNIDSASAPKGKSVVTINMLSGYDYWDTKSEGEYQDRKEKIADILIERASKLIPELVMDNIEKKIISTPITFKRYTNNSNGAIYGYARTITGQREVNPNNMKEVKNLYFASAWAKQGGGVEKVLRSADEVARKILKT